MRRIIAPVTFARDSLAVAAVASDLAAALGAELVLAGIAPVAPHDVAHKIPDMGTQQQRAQEQRLMDQLMSARLEDLTDATPGGVLCRTMLTWGPIGPALVAAARQQDADLVVVPVRRESESARTAHDQSYRYVLQHSDVPVIVVPTNGRGASLR